MIELLWTVVISLLILGVLLWGLAHFPWIDADMKQAIRVLVIVIVVIGVLLSLLGYVPPIPVPGYYRR